MSSPIFELSWDPRWNKMQKFMPHDPQNINPHDATFYAPYDMITNKRLQAIHGFSEIGPNAPQNCGAYPHQDSDVNALLDKLQLRQEKAPKSRFLHEVAKEKHSIPISSVDAASMWLSIFKAHLERYYRKKFPLNDAVNRFFFIFLRNWETLNYFNSSRLDKQFFDKFKTQHEKLTREEFHYLLRLIRHVDIAHLLEAPEIAEFVMILKQNRNQGLHSPSSSPESNDQSMLSTLLATTHTFRSQHISLEEVKQLYITIYFPNYQEIWSSDVFILNASLEKAIAQFILKFPTLHKSVLEKMFGAIDRALRE